jgi:hypothetical protein
MKKTIKKLFEKKRFSFVGKKHAIKIDDDIWTHTMSYVNDQINIMKRHGSAPNPPLTQDEYNDLVYVTAKYPQQIRNLQKKATKGNYAGPL